MRNSLSRLAAALLLLAAISAGAEPPAGAKALEEGRSHLSAGRYAEAARSFDTAFAAGYMPHEAAFGAAAASARQGNPAAAGEWLQKAGRSGFRDYERVRQGGAFQGALINAEFMTLLEDLEARAHPCRTPQHRGLDFWIGSWIVTDPAGNPAGRSRIVPDMDGCVIVENWTGRTGWTGRSFNVYRRDTGAWQQTWADSAGQIYDFTGVASESRMVYTREVKTNEGATRTIRMTLSREGANVRQLSERSDDGGKTWAVNYDFLYRPE